MVQTVTNRITPSTTDSAGQTYYTGDELSAQFADNTLTTFFAPDSTYTGYGSNGYKYNSGVIDGSDIASWSLEGAAPTSGSGFLRVPAVRGSQDSMPDRIIILTTKQVVTIIDADTLTIWMKFNISTLTLHPSGSVTPEIVSAKYANGVLGVLSQYPNNSGATLGPLLLIFNFKRDCFSISYGTNTIARKYIWNRNNTTAFGSMTDSNATYYTAAGPLDQSRTGANHGDQLPLQGSAGLFGDVTNALCFDLNYVGNIVRGIVGGTFGFFAFDCEAHIPTVAPFKEITSPLFGMHMQVYDLTVGGGQKVTITPGSTTANSAELLDPTGSGNDWGNLGVYFNDIVYAESGSVKSFFAVQSAPNVGDQILTLFGQTHPLFAGAFPETDHNSLLTNNTPLGIANKTAINSQNKYQIFRPVFSVTILSDGRIVLFGGHRYHLITQNVWDPASNHYNLFQSIGSIPVTAAALRGDTGLRGDALDFQYVHYVHNNTVYRLTLTDLASANAPAYSVVSASEITFIDGATTVVGTAIENITIDPASSHYFLGIRGGGNYYVIDINKDTLDIASVYRNRVVTAQGFKNSSGPPAVSV